MTTIKPVKTVNHIALIGRAGTGKSSTANTLCGVSHFESGRVSLPVTKTYQSYKVNCGELSSPICVIDTPGITGSPENKRVFLSEFKNAIESCNSGIQAILVVESLLGKYSNEVEDSFKFISAVLDCHLKKYGILVFTHADVDVNPSEYISKDKKLSKMVAKFDNRYVVISNIKSPTIEQQEQRSQLFSLIQKLIENNGQTGFTQRCLITEEQVNLVLDATDAESRLKTEKEAEHDKNKRLISEQYAEKYYETEKMKHTTSPEDVSHTGTTVVVKIGNNADYQNGIFEAGYNSRIEDCQDEGETDAAWKNISIHDLQKDQDLKLVLVGMTGVGKTSTGNMILGQEKLQTNKESKSNKISTQTLVYDQRQVLVIDTPGLYESQQNKRHKHVRKEILKFVAPGIPSFVIVLSTDKPFSMETEKCLRNFLKPFGEIFFKSAVVVFTGADQLKAKESCLSKHLDGKSLLESFLKSFGKRMVPFNNKDPSLIEKESQSQHLMSIVIQMTESLKTNYVYQRYKQIEQKLQDMEKIKKDRVKKGLKRGRRSVAQVPLHDNKNEIEPSDKKSHEMGEEHRQDQSIEKMGPGKCTVM